MKRRCLCPPIIDAVAAMALFSPRFARLAHEELRVAFLDEARRLLRVATVARGTGEWVEVPLRGLVRAALTLDARAMIVAHNHPGGSPAPSRADTACTRRIVDVIRPLDILLLDHLIFARGGCTSFRALGLL